MSIAGLNKLTLLDYPGKIACIIFTNACNFRCPFCHNGLTLLENKETISFEEIKTFLISRKNKLDAVVISGGEPTLLPNLLEMIKEIKGLGFLVKLDTNGTNPKLIKELIDAHLVDYIAMDIKNSLDKYPLTFGVKEINLSLIQSTIDLLIHSQIEYEFRTTLIEEFHSSSNMEEIGKLIKGAKVINLQKFQINDGVYNKNLHPIKEEIASQYVKILEKYVLKVNLRGY